MDDIVDTSVAFTHAPLPPTSSAAQPQPPRSSTPPPHDLFAGTMYFLAPSLPVGRRVVVDALLREYGGEQVDVTDDRLTTVIAPHGATRWEGWDIVAEREQEEGGKVDVVTDVWVDRSVLLGKVQSPQHYSTDPALIFSSITACAATSDFSPADLEVLAAGLSALGGQWRTALTRDVTHLFVLKTGTPKYETAVHFQTETGVKILVPHWFDDSVRLGGGLPTAEYEWPEPKVLLRGVSVVDDKEKEKEKRDRGERDRSNDTALSDLTPPLPEEAQLRLNVFTSSAYTPAARARHGVDPGTLELGVAGINPYTRLTPGTPFSLPSSRASPFPLSQPLKGKRILISRSLGLSGGRLGALHAQIVRAGGTVVRFKGDADEHESEDPADDGGGRSGGWTASATFRPGERGYKPLLAYPRPHPPTGLLQGQDADKPITRILPRLPPSERARRRAELAAVEECDVLVTRWRWGAAYVRAVRERRTVATLAWLFFLLMPVGGGAAVGSQGGESKGEGVGGAESARPAPTEQLLHYPVPKGPVEGFEKHVVTVTNYTGEAREYLKKLINAMGGTFTPSMSGQNTVLIAAYVQGTKAERARAWSIPVVNHTWLEDCFAQWRNLTVALEKYVVFPPGVDFSALLGSRGVFVGAGKHPVPGLGTITAAGAEQMHEGELGRLEAEAEELLEEYDELADEWEDERRVEKRRNAEGVEEWVPVSISAALHPQAGREEEEEESQLVQPSGTEGAEIKEVADDLIEVQDNDDDVDMGGYMSPSPAPVKPKAKANGKAKHSPAKPGTSVAKNTGKERETAKPKPKPKLAVVDADVLDLSSSDEESNAEVAVAVATPVKKGPPVSAKKATPKKVVAKAVESEGEDESDVKIVAAKKSAPSKASSSAKPVSRSKKRAVVSSDEEDAEERAEDEDEEAMETETPKAKPTKPASKATKGAAVPKSKPPAAEEEEEDESMNGDSLVQTPALNSKAKAAVQPAIAGPSKKAAEKEKADKAPPFPSPSLLARPKADARTRVVRRGPKDPSAAAGEPEAGVDEAKSSKKKKILVEVSEESEEVVVSKPNGKGKGKEKGSAAAKKGEALKSATKEQKKPAPKGKGRPRVVNTPESEDEDEEDEADEEPQAVESEPEPEAEAEPVPPRKKLIRRATAERPTTTSKPVSKSATTAHGKRIPEGVDEDSDDSLPEASHVLSNLPKRTVGAAPKSKSKGKAQEPTGKRKPPATAKAMAESVESESEQDDDDEPTFIAVKPKSKPAAKVATTTHTKNAVAGPSTPKSVLMPSLNLAGKPKSATTKETSKPKSSSKAKKPVSEEPENEEEDEDEVTSIVSPRLTRTGSLRVASGHVSTPSSTIVVKKPTNKQDKSRSKRTADEALSSEEEGTRRMPPPPQASTSAHAGPPPRRTAAAKASERLHSQIMPDVIAYEGQKRRAAEQARKGRVSMDAFRVEGEGSLEELRVQPGSSQSQSRNGKRAGQGDGDDDDDDDEEKKPTKKKRRISNEVEVVIPRKSKAKAKTSVEADKEALGKPSIHIMTTQVTLSDDVLRALLKLGIKMTSRPSDCTHLIAKQVVRTEKFLCALTRAPWIVTEAWALNCVAHKRALPEKDFLLTDKAGEDKYGVHLADSLRRAEKLQGSLFKGHTFYVTSRVPVDAKLLKNVVNACGGQVSIQTPSVRIINTEPDTRHVISCADDISIWRPLASANIKIYTQEILLNAALRQQIDWDSDEFLLTT